MTQLSAAYRLEGQVLEGMDRIDEAVRGVVAQLTEEEEAAAEKKEEALVDMERAGDEAFGAGHGSKARKAEATIAPDPEALAEVVAEDPDEEMTEEEKNEDCAQTVLGSSWWKRSKCRCPKGEIIKCPSKACNEYGRTFKQGSLKKRLGCICTAECDRSCESVLGAKTRTSKWKHVTGRDCECDDGLFLAGEHENCVAKGKDDRYFNSKKVIDRGCFCTTNATVKDAGGPHASDVVVKSEDSEDEEKDQKPVNNHKLGQNLTYGFGSMLIAGCCLLLVCRVFRSATSEDEEDIDGDQRSEASYDHTGSDGSAFGADSRNWDRR